MTAFASGEMDIDACTLTCDIRSVNHRFADISLRLPERLRFCEADIRAALGEKLKRGKIDCSINYKKHSGAQAIGVNMDAVKNLLETAAAVERLMPSPRPFSALEVLAFPGVQFEGETDRDILKRNLQQLLDNVLSDMLEMRIREGRQLKTLLEERCRRMQELTAQAAQRMPEVLQHIRSKLKERVAELIAQPDFDRIEQEMVILAQKLDVDEELDRLRTHIDEVLRILQQREPIGRRLDFLMQEMHREANTLGSKSADKEITQISIELKVLIEQMREQVQNIE
ncbi:MAG: YicC/YloC family endoribonuclease [Gammaproteobacteria bacterium]